MNAPSASSDPTSSDLIASEAPPLPGDLSPDQRRRPVTGQPVNLILSGRQVLVVGAGTVAARKIAALLEAGAVVRVVAPEVGPEVRASADMGLLTVEHRAFQHSDLDDCWLAYTAADDPSVNRAVFEEGERRRIWVNSADDPTHCSFTLVSVVRRGDIVVSIGTGGRSPALATWLKERIQRDLGPEYEALLEILAEARESLRASGRSSEDANWRVAFDSGILDLVKSGQVVAAKELLNSCL